MISYFNRRSDGIYLVSEHDNEEGRMNRFSPLEIALLDGFRPGQQRWVRINVAVSDLSDPDDVNHKGHLDLTYSYVGAFNLTVLAGTFDAALIKWDYVGKVGPAKIKDQQFRFLSEDVGLIAEVHKGDISALLIYQDHSKDALVLEKRELIKN